MFMYKDVGDRSTKRGCWDHTFNMARISTEHQVHLMGLTISEDTVSKPLTSTEVQVLNKELGYIVLCDNPVEVII